MNRRIYDNKPDAYPYGIQQLEPFHCSRRESVWRHNKSEREQQPESRLEFNLELLGLMAVALMNYLVGS